ncbi:MAG: hypothetical protein JOZ75_10850 [Candidatus Dormibacteraeota bacterium]|nr:hypothetical protein [Candidatus Dormibacteraeota bacterium]
MRAKPPLEVATVSSPATIAGALERAGSYDLVVLAAPPLQLDSTAIAIAHLFDAAVLVAAGQLTRLSEVRETSEQLREAGVSVPACLLVTKTSWGRSWYYPERTEASDPALSVSASHDAVDISAAPPPPAGNGTQSHETAGPRARALAADAD